MVDEGREGIIGTQGLPADAAAVEQDEIGLLAYGYITHLIREA